MGSKGYGSKGYGYDNTRSVGYLGGGTKHTNAEKAIFHGLKAAHRWAYDGQYEDAAEIAEAVSSAWLEVEGLELPDAGKELFEDSMAVDPRRFIENKLKDAHRLVKGSDYDTAAKTAYTAAVAYMEADDG